MFYTRAGQDKRSFSSDTFPFSFDSTCIILSQILSTHLSISNKPKCWDYLRGDKITSMSVWFCSNFAQRVVVQQVFCRDPSPHSCSPPSPAKGFSRKPGCIKHLFSLKLITRFNSSSRPAHYCLSITTHQFIPASRAIERKHYLHTAGKMQRHLQS